MGVAYIVTNSLIISLHLILLLIFTSQGCKLLCKKKRNKEKHKKDMKAVKAKVGQKSLVEDGAQGPKDEKKVPAVVSDQHLIQLKPSTFTKKEESLPVSNKTLIEARLIKPNK